MKKILAIILILFLIGSVNAAPIINPSVQEQSTICKHWYSKWLCDIAPKGDTGLAGAPGTSGEGNNTTYNYFNASLNLTSFSNETWFYNATIGNLSSFSNVTNFYDASNFTSISNISNYYNTSLIGNNGTSDHHLLTNLTTGDDHTQYLNINGRADGQIIKGGLRIGRSNLEELPSTYLNFTDLGSGSMQFFINRGNFQINTNQTGDQAGTKISLQANGGNVGIGTNIPTSQLHTTGSVRFSNFGLGTSIFDGGGNLSSTDIFKYVTGRVGIGKIPDTTLHVNGTLRVENPDTNGNYVDITQLGSGSIQILADTNLGIGTTSSGSNVLFQLNGGKFGLGISPPSTQFDTTGGVRFRNFGAGAATFDANGVISSVSDEKAKTDLNSFTKGLNELLQINPVIYKYTKESGLDTENNYVGFSAQNLQKAVPEIVYSKSDVQYKTEITKNKDGLDESKTIEIPLGTNTLSIYDRGLMALMVNAIKEQQLQIDDQQKQIDDLKIRLEKLESVKL